MNASVIDDGFQDMLKTNLVSEVTHTLLKDIGTRNVSLDNLLKCSFNEVVSKIVSSLFSSDIFPELKDHDIFNINDELEKFFTEFRLGKCNYYNRAGKNFFKINHSLGCLGTIFFEKFFEAFFTRRESELTHTSSNYEEFCAVFR